MSKEKFDCTVNELPDGSCYDRYTKKCEERIKRGQVVGPDNNVFKALNEVDPEYSGEDQKIKDSGNRREFESGAVRDIQEGKGRCDLLPLKEVARLINLNPERLSNKDLKKETTCCDCLLYINHFMNTKDTYFLLLAVRLFANKMHYGAVLNNVALGILEVAKHFEEGATKYGERNWEKGIPVHCYIDSGVRHLLKYTAGMDDERHDRAFMWNMLCAVWTIEYHPELDDIPERRIKMNIDKTKEVYFSEYCKTCVHKSEDESSDSCDECLENPSNEYSHKPINYVKGE